MSDAIVSEVRALEDAVRRERAGRLELEAQLKNAEKVVAGYQRDLAEANAARVKAEGQAAAIRMKAVVGCASGYKCLLCCDRAAHPSLIEHVECALAPDAGRALLAELSELRGKVAAMTGALADLRINLIPPFLADQDEWVTRHNDIIDRALSPGGKGGAG